MSRDGENPKPRPKAGKRGPALLDFPDRHIYRKQFLIQHCGFSEALWDEMLADATPFVRIGASSAVLREDLLAWLKSKRQTK